MQTNLKLPKAEQCLPGTKKERMKKGRGKNKARENFWE